MSLAALLLLAGGGAPVMWTVWRACDRLDAAWEERRRRASRAEAELEQIPVELRWTVVAIAETLAADRDAASREMSRVAHLAGGARSKQ